MTKVLFILKRREDFNATMHSHIGMQTGLYNSASFVSAMLNDLGIKSKMAVVVDNNGIDREVYNYKPTHVIIEAVWVTPSKFTILQKLHPAVKWVIRVHSEMPFLAGESRAIDWLGDYSDFKNIILAINAPRMFKEITFYLKHRNKWTTEQTAEHVIYLPNYYPQQYKSKKLDRNKDTIDIGCFGAIRPLKNHLVQAFAAIEFAEQLGKKLRFHVNAGRIEMQGGPVISNLKSLFQQIHRHGHELINHLWRPREEFLELCAKMDIGLQVSFSETFNIVGADIISQGIPLVGTAVEIPWAVGPFCADPTDGQDIIKKLHLAYTSPEINAQVHQWSLTNYTSGTAEIWAKYFKGH